MNQDRVIGKGGKIPWHIPDDLRHFRDITMGETIIMGRKTYESIGRELDGRTNIILGRDYCPSIEEALKQCEGDAYIIGGQEIYEQTMDIVDEVIATVVFKEVEIDETCRFYPYMPSHIYTRW